jgi:RNA recognition motif-containing protein
MDKYDLSSDPGANNDAGMLSVLEYQHGKKTQKKSFNNIYAKNFSTDPEFTDEQLATLFSTYGEILNASVMRD